MRFCKECGQRLSEECDTCPICGHPTFDATTIQENPYDAEKYRHSEMRYAVAKPKATVTLIVINVLVFLLITMLNFRGSDLTSLLSMHRGAVATGQIYRVLTSMFTHEAFFHLLSNCYALYIYGRILEPALGKGKYLFIYFVSGFFGNLLSFFLVSNPSIGASGAIFGLLGAVAAIYFINPTAMNRSMLKSVISCVVITTIYSFTGGINNVAHFGGLFGGYLATCIIVSVRHRKRILTSRVLTSVLLVVTIALSIFGGLAKEKEPYELQYGDHSVMCFLASFDMYDKASFFAERVLKSEDAECSMDAAAVRIIDGIKKSDEKIVTESTEKFFSLVGKNLSLTNEKIYNDLKKYTALVSKEGVEG